MINCFGLLLLICSVILRWRLTESTVTMVTMATKSDLHQRCQPSVVWSLSRGPILIIFGAASPIFILKLLLHISNHCLYSLMSYDCHTTRARTDTLLLYMFLQNIAKLVSDYVSLFLTKDLSRACTRRSDYYHMRWTWHDTPRSWISLSLARIPPVFLVWAFYVTTIILVYFLRFSR